MKITVIIPCLYKHFKLINTVLDCHYNNSIKPNQIIISLNGCKKLNKNDIDNLEKHYKSKFEDFFILRSKNKLNRAKARNVCFDYIKNDIVCFSDADDKEHSQRFEIIKYFFEKKKIDHLIHSYILEKCNKNLCNNCFLCKNKYNKTFINYKKIEQIDFCDSKKIFSINYPNKNIKPNVKNILAINKNKKQIMPVHGLVCVKKHVLEKIKFNENYPRGQDSLFSHEVLYKFKNSIVIDAQLHIYTNGWIPEKESFKKIELEKGEIYVNFGSPNPPYPGKPQSQCEINSIIESIKKNY